MNSQPVDLCLFWFYDCTASCAFTKNGQYTLMENTIGKKVVSAQTEKLKIIYSIN